MSSNDYSRQVYSIGLCTPHKPHHSGGNWPWCTTMNFGTMEDCPKEACNYGMVKSNHSMTGLEGEHLRGCVLFNNTVYGNNCMNSLFNN
jgi:hypothetical protein